MDNDKIAASYARTKSVWKTGKELGIAGQTVHKKLVAMGIKMSLPHWKSEDYATLKEKYADFKRRGELNLLAAEMGRTKQFICRKAKDLGLTDRGSEKRFNGVWKYMEENDAVEIWEDFKNDRRNLKSYCLYKKYDDLGFSRTMRAFFPEEWDHVIELKRPKTSMYGLGRSFEYRVRDKLSTAGFFVVRSPQSRSPADLIALKKGLILLVQCKRGGEMAVKEWNELYDLAESIGAVAILAKTTPPRGFEIKKLIGRKDGSKSRQPFVDYVVEGLHL